MHFRSQYKNRACNCSYRYDCLVVTHMLSPLTLMFSLLYLLALNERMINGHICPDDDTFQHLSRKYAFAHRNMATCGNFPEFEDGITNGAAWYSATGEPLVTARFSSDHVFMENRYRVLYLIYTGYLLNY